MPSKLPRPPLHTALSRPLGAVRTGVLTATICAAVVLAPAVATVLRRPHGALSASASPAAGAAMWDGTRRGASEAAAVRRPAVQRRRAVTRPRPTPRRRSAPAARIVVRAPAASPPPAAPVAPPRSPSRPLRPQQSQQAPAAAPPPTSPPPPTATPTPTDRTGVRSPSRRTESAEHEWQPSAPTAAPDDGRERDDD
jgi:hypothetical protein